MSAAIILNVALNSLGFRKNIHTFHVMFSGEVYQELSVQGDIASCSFFSRKGIVILCLKGCFQCIVLRLVFWRVEKR